jgi:two-component system sensor histidine kinase KdpD
MAEKTHRNPDLLLAAIQKEEIQQRRGRLKVFLGMCAGVGKTYAMLEAARREQAAGRGVVIGYVETHGRKETDVLAENLPAVQRRQIDYRGVQLSELDLDPVLTAKPQLVLVDEFAHTNAPGSRHPKRYQDILELLDAGIDVWTTLNVQHIESRAEAVRQITGVAIHETVPDTALAGAELELVDLPPDELRARLAAGKVYIAERAGVAQENFFRPGNLSALRELALRFAAEHVGEDVRDYRRVHGIAEPWKSGQRLLVGVSASPTSAALVRWARRFAGELKAPWLAVYVEQPRPLSDEEQKRLTEHLHLAGELGAEVITTSDRDVVEGLLRVAREQNVTQLVVGKPLDWRALDLWRGGSFLNRLIQASGHIDVHAVRADAVEPPSRPITLPHFGTSSWRGMPTALGVIGAVTAFGWLVQRWIGYQAIALIYLLAVVVLGLFMQRGVVLVGSLLSALLWNFLFVPPLFTFRITNAHDLMLFFTLLLVGSVIGQLTARLRAQQLAERSREERATALYLLTRELAEATDLVQLLGVMVRQISQTFRAEVALSLPDGTTNAPLTPYFASTWSLSEKEQSVAAWAFQHRQPAGPETDTLASAEGLHLPLLAGERLAGVLSLRFHDRTPLPPAQRDLLDAFVRQVALVLDRQRLRDAETQTKLLAESERLGKTLLNSVSHELRTPLAAITSSITALRDAGSLNQAQQALATEIDEATARLNRLVRNLLNSSRLEAGHLSPNFDWHDVHDLIHTTVQNMASTLAGHPLKVDIAPALPPVKLDFALTEQIVSNLLSNAATHTPIGTPIEIHVHTESGQLILDVADRGAGLPRGDTTLLFDRFQRGPENKAGGVGLGLSLVKGFAEAQGGSVTASNRPGGGAVFTVRLPLAKMPPLPEEKE